MASRMVSRGAALIRRGMSSAGAGLSGEAYLAAQAAEAEAAVPTMNMWKKVSAFVAIPAMALCGYQAYTVEVEHMSHGRAEFVPYPHLRIRTKFFPWGDGEHSLFHGHNNALPDGYEE